MVWEDPKRVLGIGLDRSDYESEKYINNRTEAYHRTTGRYPTKQETIRLLRLEKRARLKPPDKKWNKRAFEYRAMERFLTRELEQMIRVSADEDPIRVIFRFMNDMDDIAVKSDHHIVWSYAGLMRDAAQDILDRL